MRSIPTVLGVIAAFLMGAALAIAIHPRPLFREIVALIRGDSAYDRCLKAGACNAMRNGPQNVPAPVPHPQKAPADMDRA